MLIKNYFMIDIQNQKDSRNIDIKKVGVKNIKYPIIVLDRARGTQPVNATFNMYVDLAPSFQRHTHEPFCGSAQ